MPCCPHPVEHHAYNGCADCSCGARWSEHSDRDRDTSPEGIAANRAIKAREKARGQANER
jgi:hypothetical protein